MKITYLLVSGGNGTRCQAAMDISVVALKVPQCHRLVVVVSKNCDYY